MPDDGLVDGHRPATGRGLLAAVTGVVALHRLDVRRASAFGDGGRAAVELAVITRLRRPAAQPRRGWPPTSGRRSRAGWGSRSGSPSGNAPTPAGGAGRRRLRRRVRFDDRTDGATVVEVRAADRAGVLYRMVDGLGRAGLQVLTALVSTIGPDVVNSFYVRGSGRRGAPLRRAPQRRCAGSCSTTLDPGTAEDRRTGDRRHW